MAGGTVDKPPAQDQQCFARAAIICATRLELGERTLAREVYGVSADGTNESPPEPLAEGAIGLALALRLRALRAAPRS